ncbi:unnamed protein product [Rangifer tarandus platyrhynchus]|uniref:Uncharacterized protein n=2 Tax=Rangifer tarandus platyrhynchus TaxID=3082113 RepID=A0ACB0F2A7_RANTA|nr:unnamed protein product [Rangifer tarandus platyrhynchus]CAI9707095.1 unnamed protein product [Rangifer tarandus platyrhynchus]
MSPLPPQPVTDSVPLWVEAGGPRRRQEMGDALLSQNRPDSFSESSLARPPASAPTRVGRDRAFWDGRPLL